MTKKEIRKERKKNNMENKRMKQINSWMAEKHIGKEEIKKRKVQIKIERMRKRQTVKKVEKIEWKRKEWIWMKYFGMRRTKKANKNWINKK